MLTWWKTLYDVSSYVINADICFIIQIVNRLVYNYFLYALYF